MDDPYQILGVGREASGEDIKKAFRKLARGLHPDLHPNDKQAEDRFKRVNAAYALLSDPAHRARFDSGEIDAMGAEKPRRWRRPAGAQAGRGGPGAGAGFGEGSFHFGEDVDDIMAELLRRSGRGGRARRGRATGAGPGPENFGDDIPLRGEDARYLLHVTLPEAAIGATKRITMPNGKNLDVKVPRGTVEGTQLRLKGQGNPGFEEGPAGDALIQITIDPHPLFRRDGDDILFDLPVTLPEAVLGAKVTVPTLDSKVALTIPPGSNAGTVLRLKGKGVPRGQGRGDQLVTLRIVLPEKADAELEAFLRKWAGGAYRVRDKIERST